MSRVLNIVYSLLENGPEEAGPDDVNPKGEMMRLPPNHRLPTPYGEIEITSSYGEHFGLNVRVKHARPEAVNFLADVWVEDLQSVVDFIQQAIVESEKKGQGWYAFNTKLYQHFQLFPKTEYACWKASGKKPLPENEVKPDPDEIDPKSEMMRVDPTADIRRIIGRFKRQDLDVHSWSRAGDIVKIKALPLDTGMGEEEVEAGVTAELQRMGIVVDPMAVTVSKSDDGWFIIMFPLTGMPARSHKRRLPENGPDEINPKEEFMSLNPPKSLLSQVKAADGYWSGLQVVLKPSHKEGEWVTRIKNVETGGESWGHYHRDYTEAVKDFEARCVKYGLPTEPMSAEVVFETGPDEIDPKDALLGTEPTVDHWLKSIGFSLQHSGRPWYHKYYDRGYVVIQAGSPSGYDVSIRRNSGRVQDYVGLSLPSIKDVLRQHQVIAEAEDPDEVDPKNFLMRTQPSTLHWLQRCGFKPVPEVAAELEWRFKGFDNGIVFILPQGDDVYDMVVNYYASAGGLEKRFSGLKADALKDQIMLFGRSRKLPVLEDEGPDNVDPREYLRALPARNPRITIAFSRTTPESAAEGEPSDQGWVDEEGELMWPDEYDQEEGVGVADKAVKFLRDAGASQPSSSDFYPGAWYSTGYSVVDYRTGEEEEKTFHLKDFTPEEEKEIWNKLGSMFPRGWRQV